MPPAGFEPAIPAGERPQAHALHRAATGIGRTTFTICITLEPQDKLYCIPAEFQLILKKTCTGYAGYQLTTMRVCTHLAENTATLTVSTNVVRYIPIHALSHTFQ